jgi:hypothetical protein
MVSVMDINVDIGQQVACANDEEAWLVGEWVV